MSNPTLDETEAIQRSFEPAENVSTEDKAVDNDQWLSACLSECYND
jgi:hypothetical protein